MGRYESLASASRRAMPGRPGERYADSRPRRLAIRFCHSVAPYGRPRWTLRRSASNSLSLSARLTRSSQSSGTSNGHAAKTALSSAVPRQRLQRLDQRHSSARTTKLARSALRSTYRATAKKCSSSSTGNELYNALGRHAPGPHSADSPATVARG